MRNLLLLTSVAVLGCGASTTRPGSSSAPEREPDGPPRAPLATFVEIPSPAAYCAARVAPARCIGAFAAWSELTSGGQLPAEVRADPFDELRVLPIVRVDESTGCAAFVRVGDRWSVSENAIVQCHDEYTVSAGREIWWSFDHPGDRLVIETSSSVDPCWDCDDNVTIGTKMIAVCGVDPQHRPACTEPITIEHSHLDSTMRTWAIGDDTLSLGPWVYGEIDEPPPLGGWQLVPREEHGGPALDYHLAF